MPANIDEVIDATVLQLIGVVPEDRKLSYCSVTAGSEKLYMTYKCNDGEGGALFKSEIITLISYLPSVKITSSIM